MARTQTMVQLSDELLAVLDREAVRRGTSRSALIRTAIEVFLHDEREAEIDRQIVEGYRRVPPGAADQRGEPGPADAVTSAMLQRLDAEERDAGFGPWEP